MKIRYDIKVSIANKNTGTCSSFPAKTLEAEITAATDALLYDNHHIIAEDVYLFDMFKDEVDVYSSALGVPVTDLEFDSFEVTALAPPEKYQVYFDFDSDEQKQNLRPTIKVYIAPKQSRLSQPTLKGVALDKNSILWQWDDDSCAHYLVIEAIDPDNPNDADKIIAQLPIGVHEYIETPLDPGTAYTRRLIAYTDEQYSDVSTACTVWTETASPDIILDEYETPRLYDFTIDESQREIVEERMKAFHSGIGDFNDLKVYKQMDADFYQKFKAYFEITGRRIQREKRYEQTGFWYKVCLDAMERIEEQEGEVTFDVYAYPREWLRLQDYVWATQDVTVQAEFEATVFLQKEDAQQVQSPINIYECEIETVTDVSDTPGTWVWGTKGKYGYSLKPQDTLKFNPITILFIIDVTRSIKNTCSYNIVSQQVQLCMTTFHNIQQAVNPAVPVHFSIVVFNSASASVFVGGACVLTYEQAMAEVTPDKLEYYDTSGYTGMAKSDTSWSAAFLGADCILGWDPPGKTICLFFTDGGPNAYTNKYATSMNGKGLPHPDVKKDTISKIKQFKDKWVGPSKKVDTVISLVFAYNWVGGYFKDPVTGANYSQERCEECVDALRKNFGSGNVLMWGENAPYTIEQAFSKFMDYVIVRGSSSGGESGQKEVLTYDELPADFKSKVQTAKAQSGRTDPVETAAYGGSPAQYGWITMPSSGSKSGLYKEGSGKTPTLSTATDIPAENKPGGAHPGHWAPEPKHEENSRKVFKGWGPNSTKIDGVAKYDLDSMVAVKVKCGPYKYTFRDAQDCTPVVYSRKEKRAVISKVLAANPNKNYYVDGSGHKVMIYDEIMRLVQQTPEWQAGYQTLVKTSSGKAMIKGLFIKDNYSIGDDDIAYNRGWCNGMEGSVNSFTQIDHGTSSSYGDDCYLVDRNSVLQIQGYTDALIFDGEHAISAELNAYDFPQVSAIHSNGSVIVDNGHNVSCSSFMFNRRDKAMPYTGSGPYNHCVDIVECDRDIILQGLNHLSEEVIGPNNPEDSGGAGQNIVQRKRQKYQVFTPMTTDIEGSIELWYRSPVLNYRFNIEDPDAKTSLYEILPDCNPQDNYLHVVLLHIYYARNVYIMDGPNPETLTGNPQRTFNYVDEYGDDPIAYYGYQNMLDDDPGGAEGKYKWTQKMWQNPGMFDNGWYLDNFVWFQAEKMMKDIPYHDEIPGEDMPKLYGLVNGRYTSRNQDGKQDLIVQVPQFNIPTTVQDYYIHYGGRRNPINWNGDGEHPLKIYIVLTEFHPTDALVGYKWEKDCQWVNPDTGKVNDDITQDYKGCYATFSCDSVTYKDIEYYDIVETINFENQEVFDTKNNIIHYQLEKPVTEYEYVNYYLKVSTDNGDVIPLNYPSEIVFGEDGLVDFGVTFKGVVNATTKWSPRIHNGYYYLNQHEYFTYAEFNFDHEKTKVEHNDLERCIEVYGHLTIDVTLCHKAAPPEIYRGNNAIVKNSRSSLLQNEREFQWVDGKGVTLKPTIDGEYYKQYATYMYYSPVLSFPNTLTQHGPISLDYFIEDGTRELMGVEIRSYILEEGKWSDWYPLAGVEVPCYPGTDYAIPPDVPLSHAYQVRFYLQASVTEKDKDLEDYLCCYLDWKDDGDENASYNIVTITDHITTGPDHGKGVFASKIIDFGCESTVYLDIFQSNYKEKIKLYAASGIDRERLHMENAAWQDISNGGTITGRYVRYKIEIPEGEKLYWLHKKISTKETEAILPYVQGFTMEGEYHPSDVITNFINTEAFEITADGTYHMLDNFSDLTKIIGDDVLDRGYTMDEIKKIELRCTTNNIHLLYNSSLLNEYPRTALKDSKLRAMSPLQTVTDVLYTPFIFLDDDDTGYDKITVYGATPQQYCPITVEDPECVPYIQLHECTDFEQRMEIVCKDKTKYIELPTNRYDYLTMKVKVNGVFLTPSDYRILNHLIIFNNFVEIGDTIEVIYYVMYSFIAEVNRYDDGITPPNTVIYLYTGYELDSNDELRYIPVAEKYKVFFETSLRNNKFIANRLSLNPIYRTDYKGFIYLTDDNNEPYTVKIYCNPRRIKAGGYDKVDISIEVLDILGNPVINREVYIDCGAANDDHNSFDRGVINCDNNFTDMNGVVHFIYESSVLPVEATIRASVFNCAGASIEDSIIIVNE